MGTYDSGVLISAFNFFVMRSFFMQLPQELIDSSRIDGCGELRIIVNMILPLSKPVMVSLGILRRRALEYVHERSVLYQQAVIILLQVMLKKLFETDDISIDPASSVYSSFTHTSPEGIKMAVIIVATIPIIMIYPFLQRHFVKGMMVGSVKS